ncbi:MAG TPA: tetratricopeptide repeat protein, partial [Bacteroidia bacterium]|nr:tetratricopeptide repeat protein [Bacteroidia bacterium]
MYCSVEWLNSELEKCPDKMSRRQVQLNFLTLAADFLSTECNQLLDKLRIEAIAENDTELLAYVMLYTAFSEKSKGNPEESSRIFNEVLAMLPGIRDGFNSMLISQMIAFEYWTSGKRDLAFEYAYKSLRIGESTGTEGAGWAYFQFGVFYFDLKDYESSIKYFRLSETEARREGMVYQLARTYSGIGSVLIAKNELEEGLHYNKLALEGYRTVGHETAVSRALNDLGVISMRKEDYRQAETYLKEALDIRSKLNYLPGITTTQMEMAKLMNMLGREEEEEHYLTNALRLSEKINS